MLTVDTVDPRDERDALLEILRREFPDWGDDAKFDWMYLDNPLGRARVWVLREKDGSTVGVSAAFPRRVLYGSQTIDACVLGDFCVAGTHRSLGPAVLLQRAVQDATDRGELDLWYDFPSRVMLAVHRRIGTDCEGEFVRLVRPLRVDRLVEDKLSRHAMSRGLSAVGNAFLALGVTTTKRDRAWSIRPRECDFVSSEAVVAGRDGVWLEKSADYLNWRYRRDPRGGSVILEAERDGKIGGWLVYAIGDDRVSVVDAFGIGSVDALRELVLTTVEVAAERGFHGVTAAMSKEHVWRSVFEGLGFRPRGSGVYVASRNRKVLGEDTRWSLTDGDRDL